MASDFFLDESGAITTDWVVLAAAVVGLGVGTVASVRDGTTALGSDIDASLSASSVALLGDACKPAATVGTYQLSEANAAAVSQHVADWANADDDIVQQAYREVDRKLDYYMSNDPSSENVRDVVDFAAIIAGEIERRGIAYPKETGDFSQLHTKAYGSGNTTLCSTASSPQDQPPAFLMLDTYEDGKLIAKFQETFASFDTEELLRFTQDSLNSAKSAIGENDQKQASYQLDLLTLALQDLAQREKVPAEELESFTASDAKLRGYYDAAFPK